MLLASAAVLATSTLALDAIPEASKRDWGRDLPEMQFDAERAKFRGQTSWFVDLSGDPTVKYNLDIELLAVTDSQDAATVYPAPNPDMKLLLLVQGSQVSDPIIESVYLQFSTGGNLNMI